MTAVGSRAFSLVGIDTWLHFVVPLFPANGALRHVLWNSMQSLQMVVYSKKFLNLYMYVYHMYYVCAWGYKCVTAHMWRSKH